jgi:hypothetical protein
MLILKELMSYLPHILSFVTTTINEIYYTSFFITRQEEKYGMLDENPIYSYGNGAFLYVLKTPGTTLAIQCGFRFENIHSCIE